MTVENMRVRMDALWAAANREAEDLKDPFLVIERFSGIYRALSPVERGYADQVLAEWVLSDEEAKRFDALALVREFGVATATPALHVLNSRLQASDDPGAPFEREKVEDVLSELRADGATPT